MRVRQRNPEGRLETTREMIKKEKRKDLDLTDGGELGKMRKSRRQLQDSTLRGSTRKKVK